MSPLLYDQLVSWYLLLDPPADHLDEATTYREALQRGAWPRPETLLDLGAGAGNNALHLKNHFHCTLVDLSPAMLALSRSQNPTCEHLEGDMRSVRLGRTFDAVLVHDAVCYMLSEDDLRAAADTAFVHTRPGGAALFAPDHLRESFGESSSLIETDQGARSLRCLTWVWDPDPDDTVYSVEYALLLREGTAMQAVNDRHVEGLFPRATWVGILEAAGFRVELIPRPLGDPGELDEVFLCRRP